MNREDYSGENARFEEPGDLMTQAVHGDEPAEASAPPLYLANSMGMTYSRHSNSTVEAFEARFRSFEGGAASLAFTSGMAAVSQTLLGLLRHGDRVVVHKHIFYGVHSLMNDYLTHFGIEIAVVDLHDLEALADALRTPTRAVYFETVSNPHVDVINAPAVIERARAGGAIAIVDNTLLTPCLFRPMDHGANLVIHSATKYIGGHGDALGGLVTSSDEDLADHIRKARRVFGGIITPANAYILDRGLRTLPLRIQRHCDSALKVATFLESHPKVARVHYPGLASSPYQQQAVGFLSHFGAMISIELGDQDARKKFAGALRMCKVRYGFGELGTVVLLQNWTPLVRVSVGLENPEHVIDDLGGALAAL